MGDAGVGRRFDKWVAGLQTSRKVGFTIRNMRYRLLAFFMAAGKWGIGLMTGGLFSWSMAAYEHFSGKSIPGFWWAMLGFVLFIIGAFLAWNDEHQKYEAEKSVLHNNL